MWKIFKRFIKKEEKVCPQPKPETNQQNASVIKKLQAEKRKTPRSCCNK
jgi:hypothetical protein